MDHCLQDTNIRLINMSSISHCTTVAADMLPLSSLVLSVSPGDLLYRKPNYKRHVEQHAIKCVSSSLFSHHFVVSPCLVLQVHLFLLHTYLFNFWLDPTLGLIEVHTCRTTFNFYQIILVSLSRSLIWFSFIQMLTTD